MDVICLRLCLGAPCWYCSYLPLHNDRSFNFSRAQFYSQAGFFDVLGSAIWSLKEPLKHCVPFNGYESFQNFNLKIECFFLARLYHFIQRRSPKNNGSSNVRSCSRTTIIQIQVTRFIETERFLADWGSGGIQGLPAPTESSNND